MDLLGLQKKYRIQVLEVENIANGNVGTQKKIKFAIIPQPVLADSKKHYGDATGLTKP